MVVCKYFQQGSCRFGRNCRFEHVYSSKYSYNANQAPQQAAPTTVTDEQLIAQVIADIQGILRGGQWLLSSYAPFKGKPNLPGLTDLSFEEARLFIYEAKANNTLDNAISFFNHLFKEARTKYEQLTQPTPNTIKVLRSLYSDDTAVANPFESTQNFATSGGSNAASLFRSAAQGGSGFGQSNQPSAATSSNIFGGQTSQPFGAQANQTSSVFGQQSNVFGQQNQMPAQSIFAQANQSIFGQANQQLTQSQQTPAPSIFAGAAQSAFSNSVFNQSQAPPSSSPFPNVFQQKTESHNVFGQTGQQSSSIFGQSQANVFGQTNTTSAFGQSSSIFGQTTNDDGVGIYSKLEDLSEVDIEMYKSDEFKLGFIPELPPPKSLCL